MSQYCPNKHYPVWCDQESKRLWCYPRSETPDKPAQFCTFKKDSLIREFMESERISRRDAYSYFHGKTPTKQRSKWVPPLPPAMYFNRAALDVEEPLKQLFMDVNVSRVTNEEDDEKSIDTRTALFNVSSKDPMILSIEMGDVVTTYPFTESDEKTIIKHIDTLEKYAPKDELFQFLWVKGRLFDGTEGLVNMKNLYIESRIAMFAYTATDKEELSFKAGDHLYIQDKSKGDWWLACNVKKPQISGYVPANYLAICVTAITNGDNYKKNSTIYIQELANGHLQGTNEVGDILNR